MLEDILRYILGYSCRYMVGYLQIQGRGYLQTHDRGYLQTGILTDRNIKKYIVGDIYRYMV